MFRPGTRETRITGYTALDDPDKPVMAITIKRWFRRSIHRMVCTACGAKSDHAAGWFARKAASEHRCTPVVGHG